MYVKRVKSKPIYVHILIFILIYILLLSSMTIHDVMQFEFMCRACKMN